MINPLNPLENAVIWVLNHLHDTLHLSYGWSIVVLTLIVRAALLPLVVRQYRSMRQMQLLAPQIKEMQRKYKGDKKKQQEELMRLYQENNANPFASCLPLVAQIPVFLGLYYGLKRFSNHVPQGSDLSFLHIIPNITEHVRDLPVWSAAVLAAIYAGSQLLSTELSFEPRHAGHAAQDHALHPDSDRAGRLHLPLPRGCRDLLGHHQPVDGGADAHHQAPHRPAPPGRRSAARRAVVADRSKGRAVGA